VCTDRCASNRSASPPHCWTIFSPQPPSWRPYTHSAGNSETICSKFKTHLRGADTVLRSRSPEGVDQELYAFLVLYQVLCKIQVIAADHGEIDPDRISFTITLRAARAHTRQRKNGGKPAPTSLKISCATGSPSAEAEGREHRPDPGRGATTWADFLHAQADALLACDLIETVTLTGQRRAGLPAPNTTAQVVMPTLAARLAVGFEFIEQLTEM
jgi:hypothetical protein